MNKPPPHPPTLISATGLSSCGNYQQYLGFYLPLGVGWVLTSLLAAKAENLYNADLGGLFQGQPVV